MSFQGLVSGSECAVQVNPLTQILKHTEGDRSVQQDRIAGPSQPRLHQLPSVAPSAVAEQDLTLARQFFEGSAQTPDIRLNHGLNPLPDYAMIARASHPREASGPREAWAMEQQKHHLANPQLAQANWIAEFGQPPAMPLTQQNMAVRSDLPPQQLSYIGSHSVFQPSMPMGAYGMGMAGSMYPQFAPTAAATLQQDKGKGKSRDADFEAAFAQVAASLPQAQATAQIIEVTDEEKVDEVAESLRESTLEDAQDDVPDFKDVWDQIQTSDVAPPAADMAKWEAEFQQLMSSQRDDLEYDYGIGMQQAWEGGIGSNIDGQRHGIQYDEEGIPQLGPYAFESNNRYMDPQHQGLLEDAKALLENGGSLSEAALMLEAAIQKGQLGEGGYEAWILLGETRNMDEREEAGIRALTEGVARSIDAGAAGVGMLSLAISYTNESYERASHTMLLRWLRARFPSHPVPQETINALTTNATWDTHVRLTDVFISLARTQHQKGVMDPELQIALGVLFYGNADYDRAKDCFESALAVRPRDYLLWNRLGSCLSNGEKPEEALGAYREALNLRPTYTRAIYNVGVACLNIGAHQEAAEHFLSALAMQGETSGGTSHQLWTTLRRVFAAMQRPDLTEMASSELHPSMDDFRQKGFDF